MTDCTVAKQVLVARHQASDGQMALRNVEGKSMREAGMIRLVKTAILFEV
jgi:hypothetical protein